MKKYLVFGVFVMLVLSVGLVLASKPDSNQGNGKEKVISIPDSAVEILPGVFSLGKSIDKGKVVEGYAIVHYKEAKAAAKCGNGICEAGESAKKCPADCGGAPNLTKCYGFLASGAKWKTLEPYIVDSSNTRGLDTIFVKSNLAMDISKWESAAGVQILGNETPGIVDGADTAKPDGKNEVYFGSISDANAIAITIVWGVFSGPSAKRELVEWDQIYDQMDYDWSASGEAGKMDFENIATHEIGHSTGMNDLYTSECSEETMYGYADYGETKKQTLEAGDITGIQLLY